MTNAVAKIADRQPRSVVIDMSERYGMEPAAFEATLRATVCKGSVTREEFAAFLLVAKEHRLNPLTKEIYAFPAKGGGIQPVVSVDGWCRIINEHPALDGIEFDDLVVEGELKAVTCRIYRKDRQRPTTVTEYMNECRRATDTWKTWPARMLRHKALIQCSRYAFGFSGIADPDEYERQMEARPVEHQASGVVARLEAMATGGDGFHPDNVEAALAEEAALEAEFIADIDATIEAQPVASPPDGDTAGQQEGEKGADAGPPLKTGRQLLEEQQGRDLSDFGDDDFPGDR